MQRAATVALLAFGAADAFYLPGVAPREYTAGEKVELKVNKLTSTKTQVQSELCGSAAPGVRWCACSGRLPRRILRDSTAARTDAPLVLPLSDLARTAAGRAVARTGFRPSWSLTCG
jgi:hypothetical protein